MSARKTLDILIDLMIPEVRKVFLQVMQGIVDEAFIDEMIKAIETGDVNALFRATGFTPAALQPILDTIESVYRDVGNTVGDSFPRRIRTPIGSMTFRWNMRNPLVEKELRENSGAFVTRLTDEARENVRITLERGQIEGNNPRVTALDIVGRIDPVTKHRTGGVIGLTNNQEQWVANGRRYLEQLDPKYLNLELRDKRFDGTVKKAIQTGQQLPASIVDKLVNAYKNKALKYRADTVARTETIQAANRAEFLAHKQLIADGELDPNIVMKTWDSAGDNQTRHTHLELESRYKAMGGIPLDEPFLSSSGARMLYPGDTSSGAGADEIVNCRCRQQIDVDWLMRGEV